MGGRSSFVLCRMVKSHNSQCPALASCGSRKDECGTPARNFLVVLEGDVTGHVHETFGDRPMDEGGVENGWMDGWDGQASGFSRPHRSVWVGVGVAMTIGKDAILERPVEHVHMLSSKGAGGSREEETKGPARSRSSDASSVT